MAERFICPACERKATLKHHVVFSNHARLYFQCRHEPCRNHFQVLRWSGQPDRIVAQSPRQVTGPKIRPEDHIPSATQMGCPECAQYGKVMLTDRRDDGIWRRHKCLTCGPYWTCETDEGIAVHKRRRAKKAINLVGEAA